MLWKFDNDKIRLARESRGMTQEDLAAILDCTKQQISLWERKEASLTIASFMRICNALDAPPKFFFDSTGGKQ